MNYQSPDFELILFTPRGVNTLSDPNDPKPNETPRGPMP